MKIGELRSIIKLHKKEDLEYLVAELYKLVPNEKKEDYDVDDWIENPPKKGTKKPAKPKKVRSIEDIAEEVKFFSSNAYAQNYLVPNQWIPKKDRPKWRFVVKRLYKEIQAAIDDGNNPRACTSEMTKLYKVLTHSCHWQIFSAFDAFESVGITQSEFFEKIISLNRNHKDIKDFITESIRLIIDNPLNRYTLHSELILIFVNHCNTNDMLNLCFEQAEIIRNDVVEKPEKERSRFSYSSGNSNVMSYEKQKKLNNITEIGFTAKIKLFAYESAIQYYYKHYIENNPEVKLYILVSLLFQHGLKQEIINQIEKNKRLKPRKSLMDLLQYIKANDKLPQYF